jgi:hypothetical protein
MTELGYLDGVTSAVQTQINSRAEILAADRNYYVRTDGSDSNNGLANTSGGAFLTVQHACRVATQIDGGYRTININIADGTYTSNVIALNKHLSEGVRIIGNTATPANVVLQTSDWAAIGCYYPKWYLSGVTVSTIDAVYGAIYLDSGGTLTISDCVFVVGSTGSVVFRMFSNSVCIAARITVSGNFNNFVLAANCALLRFESSTLTVSGDVTIGDAFVKALSQSQINFGGTTITAAGTITGKRYDASELSLIDGNGSSTYFPGDVAGTTATGAQYV